ncbi:uncharacterized protein MONBRDRAFT_29904 [Monosiga brevicollis MX1]|uniref:6-phosphogluconolactonase n=1 Tax=Monosiga brevicollis TaxID=81824 RepID=A9VCG7_MONBE|nr:uncharacterized protein MONBRDRAFT_29904 [Monosiga brevicollis MX1]EDQ84747.1 predicted protein [Monosiga brevicollis MX1]|eukprot:XP_001750397.1 hypothetical protein [Monosiga brevicollis MX1]
MAAASSAASLWWGTYPAKGLGTPTGQGEGLWRQDPVTGEAEQVLTVPAASFMVAHPTLPLLYAVCETEASSVIVVDVSDATAPKVAGTCPTGGAFACHVLLSPGLDALYVSHYGTGELAVVPLVAATGALATEEGPSQLLGHQGSGPRTDRQEGPHAHSATLIPGGTHVLVADLGTDQLRRYKLDAAGRLTATGVAIQLAGGAGPRHVAVQGNLLYVTCELDHQLRVLRWDAATATATELHAVPSTRVPSRTSEEPFDGHLLLINDGRTLLVAVRGPDVVAIFDVDPANEAAAPQYRGSFDVGHWPRYFALIGDRLHVAAERGHTVYAFALADILALGASNAPPDNKASQLPRTSTPITSPACVVAR